MPEIIKAVLGSRFSVLVTEVISWQLLIAIRQLLYPLPLLFEPCINQ